VGLISQHQLSTFSSPVNGTSPIDANTVRGNDNTVKTAYNAHDADTTIHVQNGAVATRPAASIAGQMWLASDAGAVYLWLDTGSAWVDINYIRSTATSLPAGVVGSSLTSVGTLTGLTVSGTSSLQAVTATAVVIGTDPTTSAPLRIGASIAGGYFVYFANSNAVSPTGVQMTFTGAAPNNTGNEFFAGADNVGQRFAARSNGGIANYTANNVNLSDERTKYMGAVIDGRYAADAFAALAPAWQRFQYKDQTHGDDNIGTGAHALYALLPEDIRDSIVNTTDGWGEKDTLKLWTIYETDLNYLSHAAVSNLAQRVAALEAGAR
jgi:hypothetical protein